jgi:hypothetical protein
MSRWTCTVQLVRQLLNHVVKHVTSAHKTCIYGSFLFYTTFLSGSVKFRLHCINKSYKLLQMMLFFKTEGMSSIRVVAGALRLRLRNTVTRYLIPQSHWDRGNRSRSLIETAEILTKIFMSDPAVSLRPRDLTWKVMRLRQWTTEST